MSPADRLPPSVTPPGGSDKEPYLYPRTERDVAYTPPRTELEPDAEPPFATMPEVSERELQADTLAFEQVGRRKPRNWGWLKLVLVLAILGGGGYGAYKKWGEDFLRPTGDDIPTVRAVDGPFKVRPETPGGADVPNRDKEVYGLLERDKAGKGKAVTESLSPRPEAPMRPPLTATPPSSVASEESSPQMTIGPGESDDDETEMVEVKPDGVSAASQAAPAAPSAASPSPNQVRSAAPPPPPPPPPAVKSEEQIATAPATSIPARAFKIQLGAVRTEAAAWVEWDKMRKTYASVLGRLALNIERADLGTKGVYFRIQAGPFNDRAAADAACQEMARQKIPCLPIRPEG